MKPARIAIIDYGLGNLFNVLKAFEFLEIPAFITDEHAKIMDADGAVLPGVGSFPIGMDGLRARGLDRTIKDFAVSDRPLLGICLGMQMLMDEGIESGRHVGLGLVPGQVSSFQTKRDTPIKVPHMGWSEIQLHRQDIFPNLEDRSTFYFVHSFFVEPESPADIVAESSYGNTKFCSILAHKNVFGCQFHPEKSGNVGLKLLNDFAALIRQEQGGLAK